MSEILIQAVLRNTTTRKDAAYVVAIHHAEDSSKSTYTVVTYWGRWDTFVQWGVARLQSQEKYVGSSLQSARGAMYGWIQKKRIRGYDVQASRSTTPYFHISSQGAICEVITPGSEPVPAKNVDSAKPKPAQEPVKLPKQRPDSIWTTLEIKRR